MLQKQEIESSVRKSSRKTIIGAPTPGRLPPVFPMLGDFTPRRLSQFPNTSVQRNNKSIPVSAAKKNGKEKSNNVSFPAFVDTFNVRSPVKSPTKSQKRTKSRVSDMEEMFRHVPDDGSFSSPLQSREIAAWQSQKLRRTERTPLSKDSNLFGHWNDANDVDVDMNAIEELEVEDEVELEDEIGPPLDHISLDDQVRCLNNRFFGAKSISVSKFAFHPCWPAVSSAHTTYTVFRQNSRRQS